MGALDHYDRQGNPITFEQWVGLMENDLDYRVVEQTEIPETNILVSTVYLGLDHNFGFSDPRPVIFETMIFNLPEDHPLHDYQERYCTEEEAREGHNRAIALVVGPALAVLRTEENNHDQP